METGCTIKKRSYCQEVDCSVCWLGYKDCDRVVIVERFFDRDTLDPNFASNSGILARFPATEIGYENALAFVAFMNGGECSFDFVPGKGYNIIEQGVI